MILEGRACIVTGSARGIGYAIAEEFGRNGARVVISDVLADLLDHAVARISESGVQAIGIAADVTVPDQVAALVQRAKEEFGSVDVLVNNAGVTRDTLLIRMSEADWDTVLKVNLKGSFLMTQAVAKVMIKQRRGKIINISSVVGLIGNPGQVNYSASKAGLLGLTKSAARELAGRGICVNAVAPGFIETEMTAAMSEAARKSYLESIPLGRGGLPKDIADAVLFLASSSSDYITGQVLCVDGGLHM